MHVFAVERRPVNLCLCFAWFVLTGDERNEWTRVALNSMVGVTAVGFRHCVLVCHDDVDVAVKKRSLARSQLLSQKAEESRSWHWQICSVQL